MPANIFKLFKHSIETVRVKNTPRGTLETETPVFDVELEAIVKRRKNMAEAVNDSEDYNNKTTIHFKPTDAQYIKVGHYVQIDGLWHSIIDVKDGKDFDLGASQFIYAAIGDDILQDNNDPVWGGGISA